MKNKIQEALKKVYVPRRSEDWKILFDYYNEQHPDKRPLQMSCAPCFFKVKAFCQSQLDKNLIPDEAA